MTNMQIRIHTHTALLLSLLSACGGDEKSDARPSDGGVSTSDAAEGTNTGGTKGTGGGGGSAGGGATGAGGGAAGMGGAAGKGGADGMGAAAGGAAGMAGASGGPAGMGGASAAKGGLTATNGDHFCKTTIVPAAIWTSGLEQSCTVHVATMPPFTPAVVRELDYACTADSNAYVMGTVVPSCSRTDVVGYCELLTSPVQPFKRYKLIYKSAATPDTAALSVNYLALCGLSAFDPVGKKLEPKCTGKITATIDGKVTDLSEQIVCTFKTDGTKSEYFVSGHNMLFAATDKMIQFAVHEEGGKYTIPGSALTPGVGFRDGNTPFAFPKDPAAMNLVVTKFTPSGAGLTATFSVGEIYQQPGGKGNFRTITDGSIDIKITP